MQELIKKYERLKNGHQGDIEVCTRIMNSVDFGGVLMESLKQARLMRHVYAGMIADLKAAAVSIDAAPDTSAAKLRRVEAGRLTWQARAERLRESLNDANSQIEDLQDAADCGGGLNGYEFDEISIDDASADGAADIGDGLSCPECGFGKTAVFEELDWVLFCKECGHIFRKTDGSTPPPRLDAQEADGVDDAEEMAFEVLRSRGWAITSDGRTSDGRQWLTMEESDE